MVTRTLKLKTEAVPIDEYIEVCDQTLGVYGQTYLNNETFGLFDFAKLVIDPEYVLVKRLDIAALIIQANTKMPEVTTTKEGNVVHLVLRLNGREEIIQVHGAFKDREVALKKARALRKRTKQQYIVAKERLT